MARGFDYLSPGRLTIMLNNAKNAFEDVWEWPWLWRTLTGTAPLDADRPQARLHRHTPTGNELLGLDVRQIAQSGTSLQQTGTPQYWWLDGPDPYPVMHTWPAGPARARGRLHRRKPRTRPHDTDAPLIPPRYRPLWIDYAVVEAYKDSDNYQGAQALRADIDARMQDLIARYEVRNRQHSVLNTPAHLPRRR